MPQKPKYQPTPASQMLVFYTHLVSLTGDYTAAVVLSRIMSWYKMGGHRKVVRFGVNWMPIPRAELCEATAIRLDQYKRVMPLLEHDGWITQERHLFQGKVTPHIRLTIRALKVAKLLMPTEVFSLEGDAAKPIYNVQSNSNSSNKSTICICDTSIAKETESTEEVKTGSKKEKEVVEEKKVEEDKEVESVGTLKQSEEHGAPTAEVVSSPSTLVIFSLDKAGQQKGGWFMKAEDALKAHKAALTGSLGGFWKSRCALINSGYQKDLSGKEHGQLKQLSKKLGDEVRPVITYAIEHWWTFASTAGFKAGHQSWPQDPHTGYLLMHYHVAVELLHKSLKPKPKPVYVPLPDYMQSVAPIEEVAPKLSALELDKLLEDLKSP